MRTDLNLSSSEIIQKHREAYRCYDEAKQKGYGEIASRQVIKEAGHANIDAWEHISLFAIPDDLGYLRRVVESGRLEIEGQTYEPLKNMVAAFRLHIEGQK